MSLATSGGLGGGGMGGGGMMMAHQANAVGRAAPPKAPPQAKMSGTAAPPPSAAALGADLLDKSQGMSLKTVKNVSHLPIVAIDLHGSEAHVAYFPKKPEDPSKGVPPVAVSKLNTDLLFQSGEAAHKSLRKYLGKSKTYISLKADSFAASEKNAVVIRKPHRWLGLRRVQDAPDFVRLGEKIDECPGLAIAEETSPGVGVWVANSTLDGSTPVGDDYDRAVFKVRLHNSKKAISIVPDEAVDMVLREAQYLVASKLKADPDDQEISEYPYAVALPAFSSHDAAVEAMLDAMGGSGVLFQRNVAALAGALLPSIDGRVTPLLERMSHVRAALQKQHQKRQAQDPGAIAEDEIMLLVFGMTGEGFEATAVQVSSANLDNISCLFGDFKVISNVSYQDKDPISRMEVCLKDLEKAMDTIAPEADGPSGIILCGSLVEQQQMSAQWGKVKNEEWKNVPLFPTPVDCVAKGVAVLGAISHGRLSQIDSGRGRKSRAELGIRVQNVAPVAVAIQMNYHGGANDKWTAVKTIFDFDRQIPAGPISLDLNSAECAVYRNDNAANLSEVDFLKATKKNEGAKGIPQREEAALNFNVQILQRWTRDGEWKKVGDALQPLVKTEEDKHGNLTRIACERVAWELSLGVTGMITSSFVGERESVVVATKSARNSTIRYYLGIIFAILFFGGFLFKSYWDEHVLNRDTARLLAFYKHVVPGSFHAGDEHSARYTCYKYRNKKEKLWRNLEKKYGEPVLNVHDYAEMRKDEAAAATELDDETVDLDDGDDGSKTEDATQEAPDL